MLQLMKYARTGTLRSRSLDPFLYNRLLDKMGQDFVDILLFYSVRSTALLALRSRGLWRVTVNVCPIPVLCTTVYPLSSSLSRTWRGSSSVSHTEKNCPFSIFFSASKYCISSGSECLSPTMQGPASNLICVVISK